MLEIAIVGGGLCGLALANSLQAEKLSCAVFEARDRLGGRIHTKIARNNGLALDMGATWYWPNSQPRITRLVDNLGLTSFAQHETGSLLSLKDADSPPQQIALEDLHGGARRIDGGAASLIQALAARLPADMLHLEQRLSHLIDRGSHIELHFQQGQDTALVEARQVVLALPPRLVEEKLTFEPPLNGQLRETLRETPTWMAGNAKLLASFGGPDGKAIDGETAAAFWRAAGQSGNASANHPRAVLSEVHDACDALGERAGLSAFFALAAPGRTAFRVGLPLLARSQLGQLFGAGAQDAEIHIQDWAEEAQTCACLDRVGDAAHPDYAHPLLRIPYWNGRLHLGGSETAAYGGGYMEGALEAAGRLRRELLITRASLTNPANPQACAS
jgi:monoamine oxidase